MLLSQLALIAIVVLMAGCGCGILRKQSAAESCSAHNRFAGWLAILLAYGLLLLCLVILAIVILGFLF